MTIDLSNQAHVEALRWACNQIRKRSVTLTADATKLAALDVITDPTLAADLLRRLLERCGVDAEALNPRIMHLSRPVGAPWVPCVGYGAEDDRWHCITMDRIPSVVLALLDAPDRDAALAALRGEQ